MLGVVVGAVVVVVLLAAALLAYAYGLGYTHKGKRVDIWVGAPGGAAAVARRARSVKPVIYRRVWRVGPVVVAWLSESARGRGEGWP